MIGIVSAMAEEIAAIVEAASAEAKLERRTVIGQDLLVGRLTGREVTIAQCGVGKVAAASTAALLCERVDALLMVGTAGGLGPSEPGDVVVATEALQQDFDARPLWPRWVLPAIGISRIPTDRDLTVALRTAARTVCAHHRPDLAGLGLGVPSVHTGLVISRDGFVSTAEGSAQLVADLPDALAVEMEGAAVAQVCHRAGVPFGLVRTVSDRADHTASVDFPAFLHAVAAPYARDLVVAALPMCP